MEAVNRKLIRPSLNEIKEQIPPARRPPQPPPQKKPVPPDQTNAENFYYVKQMQAKTPMVFRALRWARRCTASSSGTTSVASR